jgi:hypothetical protein
MLHTLQVVTSAMLLSLCGILRCDGAVVWGFLRMLIVIVVVVEQLVLQFKYIVVAAKHKPTPWYSWEWQWCDQRIDCVCLHHAVRLLHD